MKVRSGFVSNSSSSSFIVIGTLDNNVALTSLRQEWGNREVLHVTPDLGVHQFGWEHTEYNQFWDRVMFSWIQAKYVEKQHPDWMRMLNRVMKEKLKVKQISWEISLDSKPGDWNSCCYIDHQSASSEGENTEMFLNEQNLVNFLFSTDSYIQGGNDNE